MPLLPAGRAGTDTVYSYLINTVFFSVMYLLYCNSSYYYIYINFNVDILPCLFDSIIKLFKYFKYFKKYLKHLLLISIGRNIFEYFKYFQGLKHFLNIS